MPLVSWRWCCSLAAVCGLAAVVAATVDVPVTRALQSLHLPGELRRLVDVSEAFAFGGSVALIALTAAVLDPRGLKLGLWIVSQGLGAGIVANVCKLLIARQRPLAIDWDAASIVTWGEWFPMWTRPEGYSGQWQSFPSAHTATGVALAVALGTAYPRGRWLFASFAAMAAFQRLSGQAHYLSDVCVGAGIGLLVAAAVQWGWAEVTRRLRAAR